MLLINILISLLLWQSCRQSTEYTYPFQDPSLSVEERAENLLQLMHTEEKASQLLYCSPAIDRLGIPAYNWWNESLHGVGRAGVATVFPQAIGLAATFDNDLLFRIGDAIAVEARIKFNASVQKDNRSQYMGLTFWSPNINIFRDPRWGRGQETYGEDPYLCGVLGSAYVKGLQGTDNIYLKAAACAKHFAVHSGPEESRHRFNAVPVEQDLYETYLPAFEKLVKEAHVEAVMCAYNRLYDQPCCGNDTLLNAILRKKWGFSGHIVSDCWALDDIWLRHKTVETQLEAAVMAAQAGVNLNCGYLYSFLPEALQKGLITDTLLDHLLKPLLITRLKLGMFDFDQTRNPYANIREKYLNSDQHKALAYEAAVKSIVLLKNQHNTLPLNIDNLKRLVVLGPMAGNMESILGNYHGYSGELITILEGITQNLDPATSMEYNMGFVPGQDDNFSGFWQAQSADAVILCLGINPLMEGENGDAILNRHGGDRIKIELPENQLKYAQELKKQIGNTPMIIVLTGGSAMAFPEINQLADAVLLAWYPGEQGGKAVSDIIFGQQNPSGRLPLTFYAHTSDLPDFDNYAMANRTYRYYSGQPLYPFGFGLSYSDYSYSDADISNNQHKLIFNLTIKNNSDIYGEEVVQIFAKKMDPVYWRPLKQLVAFKRISLRPGETKMVSLDINFKDLMYWDTQHKDYHLEPGMYQFFCGPAGSDQELKVDIKL